MVFFSTVHVDIQFTLADRVQIVALIIVGAPWTLHLPANCACTCVCVVCVCVCACVCACTCVFMCV